ncbi:MAG TPA: glycosyltransferase family 4 protein [Candidatus Eremiobacteraceae bacterium]|nr:glycosyltransferase family 4 protein [Candidatus Eremiobacteraceae bacterium]
MGGDDGVSRKLHIVSVINELYFGGDESRLLSFARSIDRDRFELSIVTLKRADSVLDPHYGTMRQQYADAGVHVEDLGEGHANDGLPPKSPLRLARAAVLFARTLMKLCRLIRRRRVDVIDAHLGPGNLVGVTAGVLTGTPRAVTTYHVEQWEPLWLWRLVHRWTLRASNAIITDSTSVADTIRRFIGRRDAPVLIIPNGLEAPLSERTVAAMRAELDLPADPAIRIVGQISTLLPTKGHMVLLDAARIVLDAEPNTAFLMVGFVREDPGYKDRLIERARQLQIADRVRIVSYPGPIADIWKVVDVQAHPTLLDSLPNAIIEGMSLGVPAVVTSVGGIPTIVEDGRTGIVVAPGDAPALAAGLLRILRDREYARALADAARSRFLEGYTSEVMARRLESALAGLAQ